MSTYYPHILLVEDDDVEAEAVIRAFERHQVPNQLTHVIDGIEALAALRGEQGYTALPQPNLILLDINMPRMSGIEFLQTIRQDGKLKSSIVFVLTTSYREEDKMAAYAYQVAGYILKENAGYDFAEVVKLLDQYQMMVEWPNVGVS